MLDDKLMATAAEWMTQKSDVTPVFGAVPEGVEVSRRVGPGKQIFVMINYSPESRERCRIPCISCSMASKQTRSISPYGVAVALDK